jgi:hypothetical protein
MTYHLDQHQYLTILHPLILAAPYNATIVLTAEANHELAKNLATVLDRDDLTILSYGEYLATLQEGAI